VTRGNGQGDNYRTNMSSKLIHNFCPRGNGQGDNYRTNMSSKLIHSDNFCPNRTIKKTLTGGDAQYLVVESLSDYMVGFDVLNIPEFFYFSYFVLPVAWWPADHVGGVDLYIVCVCMSCVVPGAVAQYIVLDAQYITVEVLCVTW